jgi:hypothetical protein
MIRQQTGCAGRAQALVTDAPVDGVGGHEGGAASTPWVVNTDTRRFAHSATVTWLPPWVNLGTEHRVAGSRGRTGRWGIEEWGKGEGAQMQNVGHTHPLQGARCSHVERDPTRHAHTPLMFKCMYSPYSERKGFTKAWGRFTHTKGSAAGECVCVCACACEHVCVCMREECFILYIVFFSFFLYIGSIP